MGAVSKIQIQYGCSFVTAYKTEGICQFVTKHKKELQEILHNKDRRELETLFQKDNILNCGERIKLCRYLGDHRKDFCLVLDDEVEKKVQRYLVRYFQKG